MVGDEHLLEASVGRPLLDLARRRHRVVERHADGAEQAVARAPRSQPGVREPGVRRPSQGHVDVRVHGVAHEREHQGEVDVRVAE